MGPHHHPVPHPCALDVRRGGIAGAHSHARRLWGRKGGTAHADLDFVVRWLCEEEVRDKCGITMEAGDWQALDLGEEAPQQHNGW